MWARAAVALRNINICEMPSHDAYLGVGLGQGERGLMCLVSCPLYCVLELDCSLREPCAHSCSVGARSGCFWAGLSMCVLGGQGCANCMLVDGIFPVTCRL